MGKFHGPRALYNSWWVSVGGASHASCAVYHVFLHLEEVFFIEPVASEVAVYETNRNSSYTTAVWENGKKLG